MQNVFYVMVSTFALCQRVSCRPMISATPKRSSSRVVAGAVAMVAAVVVVIVVVVVML